MLWEDGCPFYMQDHEKEWYKCSVKSGIDVPVEGPYKIPEECPLRSDSVVVTIGDYYRSVL